MASTDPLDTRAGAAVYSPWTLRVYDTWVLGISNRYAWRCPTREVLLPFYRRHAGPRHLDVGVGTGFYPAHAGFDAAWELSLLDLNPNSLIAARDRSGRGNAAMHEADVMAPLSLPPHRYDSIALFYLLHCLPGTMGDKQRVFANLKPHLHPDGCLYGATILGDGAGHNGFGRRLMAVYNGKGIFGNRGDDIEGLRAALVAHFDEVDIQQHGVVALFTARRPRA